MHRNMRVFKRIGQMTHNSARNLRVLRRIWQMARNFAQCLPVLRWMRQMARDSAKSFRCHMVGRYITCITGLVRQTDRQYVLQTNFIAQINNAGSSTNSINWRTDWHYVTRTSADRWNNTASGSTNSINWWTDWHCVTRTSSDRWINTASGSTNSINWQTVNPNRQTIMSTWCLHLINISQTIRLTNNPSHRLIAARTSKRINNTTSLSIQKNLLFCGCNS